MVDFEIVEFPSPHNPDITIYEMRIVHAEHTDLKVMVYANSKYINCNVGLFTMHLKSADRVEAYREVFFQANAVYDKICRSFADGHNIASILDELRSNYRTYRSVEN